MAGKHIRTTLVQTELFSPLGFDEVAQFLGIVETENIDEDQRYTTLLPLFSYICR